MVRTNDPRLLPLVEAATLISGIGNGIALVALPWLVLKLTGRTTAAGIVVIATALPPVVSPVFSGTVFGLLGDVPDTPPDETDDDRILVVGRTSVRACYDKD